MLNIIIQKFKEQRTSVSIYTGALIGYTLLMISMFPSIKKMDIEAMMKDMPEQFVKFFGDEGMASYNTIEGYISMEFLSFFFILILTFYIGSVAGSAIAGQIEKRTIDFNLSQPISRTKSLLAEGLVAIIYSALIIITCSLAMFLLGKIFDSHFKISGLIAFTAIATLFMWSIFGIAMFISSIFKSKSAVMLTTFGITLFMYIFLSLTRMVEKLKDYDKLSIFYLYDPQKLLKSGEINLSHAAILFAIFAIGLISSIVIFNKKDL